MKEKILIFGGSGAVGFAAVKNFVQKGHPVRVLVPSWDRGRARQALETLKGVEVFEGDVRDSLKIGEVMKGVTYAVNAAAAMPDLPDKKQQYETNVLPVEFILRSAAENRVGRVVFISTAGVATHTKKRDISDETAPYRKPHNIHVWSKIEAEKKIDHDCEKFRVKCVTLRPVSIYGEGVTFRWPQIFEMIRRNQMRLIDGGECPYPLIHLQDVALAIESSLFRLESSRRNTKIILDSGEPLTMADIVNTIADYFGVRRPRSYPYPLVYAGSIFIKMIPNFLKSERLKLIHPGTAVEYKYGHQYNIERARKLLNYFPSVSFSEGMRKMLVAYESSDYRN